VHGGGWFGEIARAHWNFVARLASETSIAVTVPIYPLVPFGTAAQACEGVAASVRRSILRFGPTCLAGDSAKGQIVLSTALALRDEDVVLPRTVLVPPALDLSWSNPRISAVQPSDPMVRTVGTAVFSELWRGDLDVRDPTVSPLFGEYAGLGSVTVFTGTREVLNPDVHLLAEKATSAGVSFELHEAIGQLHVYPFMSSRVGREAQVDLLEILRRAVA